MTAIALAVLLGALLSARKCKDRPLLRTHLDGFVILLLLYTAVAYLASPLPELGLPKLTVTICGVFGYYLVQASLEHPSQLDSFIRLMVFAAGATAGLGLFTLHWPAGQIVDLRAITDRVPHLGGEFTINHNEMAGTLLLLMPYVLAVRRRSQSQGQRFLATAILLLVGSMFVLAQSRGAFLALLLVGAIWAAWGRFQLRTIFLALAVAVLLISPAIMAVKRAPAEVNEWLSRLDASTRSGEEERWLSRLEIWRAAGQMLYDYPVFGAGLFTFEPVSRANYPFDVTRASVRFTHAHNLFLQAGVSYGWGGTLAHAGLWTVVISGLWHTACRSSQSVKVLSSIFGTSLLGYLVFNMFDTVDMGQKPGVFVWLALAGSVRLIRWSQSESVTEASAPDGWQRVVRWAPGVLAVLSLLFTFTPAMQRNLANVKLDHLRLAGRSWFSPLAATDFQGDARRLGLWLYHQGNESVALAAWRNDSEAATFLIGQGSVAARDSRLESVLPWFDLALTLDPSSVKAYYERGLAYERFGMIAQAAADFGHASSLALKSDLAPDRQGRIAFDWGRTLAAQGKWSESVAAFRQATVLDPEVPWYHDSLADALSKLSEEVEARAALQKAQDYRLR